MESRETSGIWVCTFDVYKSFQTLPMSYLKSTLKTLFKQANSMFGNYSSNLDNEENDQEIQRFIYYYKLCPDQCNEDLY